MNYLVIGAGRMAVGIIFDLLKFGNAREVAVTDISSEALQSIKRRFPDKRVKIFQYGADQKPEISKCMDQADGALSAVPYEYNINLTRWAIENRCHFVDLGGNNSVVDAQFALSEKARENGVGIFPDCGLAPGMASIVAAELMEQFPEADSLGIRVGGLPVDPKPPLNYMLVFSVHGLTNEYIEPSVIIKNRKLKKVPSMTGLEDLVFPAPFNRAGSFLYIRRHFYITIYV